MKKQNRVGEKHTNKVNDKFIIIEYNGWEDCTIKYTDGTIVKNVCYANIKKGEVKNPNTPSIKGVGYTGQGRFKTYENGIKTVAFNKFLNMMDRCYDKEGRVRHSAYKLCTVDSRWHNFQVFAQWIEENYKPHMEGWQLDKDIKVKGNKIYSPETCMLVPRELNNIFPNRSAKRGKYPLGVYKEKERYVASTSINKVPTYIGTYDTPEEAFYAYKDVKEKYIKEMSDKWKSLLSVRDYNSMISYRIEITD